MKKSALRQIIRESIQELLTEQTSVVTFDQAITDFHGGQGIQLWWGVCDDPAVFNPYNADLQQLQNILHPGYTQAASNNCCKVYYTGNILMSPSQNQTTLSLQFDYINALAALLFNSPGTYDMTSGVLSNSSNLKTGIYGETNASPSSNQCLASGQCTNTGTGCVQSLITPGPTPVGPLATLGQKEPDPFNPDLSMWDPKKTEPNNLNRRG